MAEFSVNPTRRDPYKNFKFQFTWDRKYVAGVSKSTGLSGPLKSSSIAPAAIPPPATKSPGRTEFDAITLERGITEDTAFEQWASKVWRLGAALGMKVSLKDFRKDIILELYNEAGRLCRTSIPTPMPSPYSTSSWRMRVGSGTSRSLSPTSRHSQCRADRNGTGACGGRASLCRQRR
jgi:phage tail-like protein